MATLPVERQDFEDILEAYLQQFIGTGGGTGGTGTILPARLSIINAVKAKIDELIPEGEGVQFTLDTVPNISNPYDIFINVFLDEVAKELLLITPLHILEPELSTLTTASLLDEDYLGRTAFVYLPVDFLRLQEVKMAAWERPVAIPITTTDPAYMMQKNIYVRGGISKPVAALNFSGSSKTLELYSVPVNDDLSLDYLRYIPERLAEDVQGNLFDALTWLVANKVLQVIGQLDLSKLAYEKTILCFKDMQ